MEEEQSGVAGLRVSVDVDVVSQRLTAARQFTHERQVTPEQAVHPLAAIGEVGSQPRRQQQVGLAGLDDHSRRHPADVHVPLVGGDVGLGDDSAGAHRTGLALDTHHPIGEEQWRLRHAHQALVLIEFGELRSEHLRDGPAGEHLELGA